jgi:hypothetical protein
MNGYCETGYLFLQSYDLEEKEIRNHLDEKIKEASLVENFDFQNYQLYINVVKNRDEKNLGYSYIWTDSKEIYNLFSCLNLDGSKRIKYYEDPYWVRPVKKEIDDNDWAAKIEEEENQTCPILKEDLPPIVDIEYYRPGDCTMRIGPTVVEKLGKNNIYSKNIDPWITEKILFKNISMFEKDKAQYNNKGKYYNYPIINIRKSENKKRNVNIIFSPKYPQTASFLIQIIKKIKIKYNNKEKLIFFSQSKK